MGFLFIQTVSSFSSTFPQETLYDDLQAYYPPDFDPNSSEHSGKLKVLDNLLKNIRGNSPAERVVLVSNYTQVCKEYVIDLQAGDPPTSIFVRFRFDFHYLSLIYRARDWLI